MLGQLNDLRAAAAAVLGERSDEEATVTADGLALSLFSLPEDTSLASAEQAALRVIVEWQGEVQRRAQDIHRQLTQAGARRSRPPAIVEKLAYVTGKPVAMEDSTAPLRLYASPRDNWLSRQATATLLLDNRASLEAWAKSITMSASDPPVTELDLPAETLSRLVAPVVARDGAIGFLSDRPTTKTHRG